MKHETASAQCWDSQDLQRPSLAQLLLIKTVENHLVLVILASTCMDEDMFLSHEAYLYCHHQLNVRIFVVAKTVTLHPKFFLLVLLSSLNEQ